MQPNDRDPGPIEVPLWPGRPHPAMKVVFPGSGSTPRPAMVVFRGGAYSTCWGSGAGSAEWAADQGMVGIRVLGRGGDVGQWTSLLLAWLTNRWGPLG